MMPLGLLAIVFLLLVAPFVWHIALRCGLAGMFLLTASAHWGKRRPDLIRMVPKSFPRPEFLVTLTGICEILGVVGLLVLRFARWAAIGLTLLLIAVFPANIRAAREGITIGGKPATPLLAAKLDTGPFPDRNDSDRDGVKWLAAQALGRPGAGASWSWARPIEGMSYAV
jgi:uncharacterized membrane protein